MQFHECRRADADIYEKMLREHYATTHVHDRRNRLKYARGHSCVIAFYVDRGHRDGPEYHCITDNACIVIFNAYTHRLVTVLLARPGQIDRYFAQSNASVKKSLYNHLIKAARENQASGLNQI